MIVQDQGPVELPPNVDKHDWIRNQGDYPSQNSLEHIISFVVKGNLVTERVGRGQALSYSHIPANL